MTGPSAEAGVAAEDAELWWQDYLPAEHDLVAELGDDDARRHLRRWLGRLAARAAAGNADAREFLAENPDWRQYADEQAT